MLCGALALGLVGCGSSGDDKAPAVASASTSASKTADPEAAERTAVLRVYQAMNDAETHTYATGKVDPQLEMYAAHKALSDIKVTLFYYQQQGTVMKGSVTRSPQVTSLDTSSVPLKAVVTDCADSSKYDQVNSKTGKVVPYKGPRRHVVTSTAERSKAGPWKFYTSVIERDRTC